MRPSRAALAVVAALVLTSCSVRPGPGDPSGGPSVVPTLPSTPPPVTLTVQSGNVPLKVRHVPGTDGNELAKIPSGSSIIVDCRLPGTRVTGSQGTTDEWLHLQYQGRDGYVAAAFVSGAKTPPLPDCAVTPAIAASPRPAPAAAPSGAPAPGDPGATIAEIARSQVGVAEKGSNCHPYGKKCEEWCGYFASWVWQRAGIKVPVYPFTGDFYAWGKRTGRTHDGVAGVGIGDLVLYGTGPKTVKTSTHVDIVVEVHADHLRVVGGNVDDRVVERDVPLTGIYGYVAARG